MRRVLVLLRLLAVASACALVPVAGHAQLDDATGSSDTRDRTTPDSGEGSSRGASEGPSRPHASRAVPTGAEGDVDVDEGDPWAESDGGEEATRTTDVDMPELRYFLESVRIEGNARTHAPVIRAYVPLAPGDVIDADSDLVEGIAWALRGTGYFDRVRIRLERGSRRGWVVLVIEVRERNTIVVQRFQPGVSLGLTGGKSMTVPPTQHLIPYVGFQIAETNVLGTGSGIEVAGLISQANQGVRIGFTNPRVLGTRYAVRVSPFFNNAREYFGSPPVTVTGTCDPTASPDCMDLLDTKNAVVFYRRGGVAIGAGRAVGVFTHYSLDWQGEIIHVISRPELASQKVHGVTVPINFGIDDGTTFNSVLRLSVVHDRRDDPALPTRGLLLRVEADIGTRLLGSRYDFVRVQALVRGWLPLASRHTLRLSAFIGATVGDTPFFYQFHASDLSDLIPSRFLEMEIDRRAPLNVFNTSIDSTRLGDIATRFDIQYEYSLYETTARRPVRLVHAYANVGVYTLNNLVTASVIRPTYSGFARIPLDLTFDVGLRIDTDIGVFDFGLSNIVGFIPWIQ